MDERCLTDERCTDLANDGGTGQGITPGEPYLLWVVTANGATGRDAVSAYRPVDMFPVGGTFKYKSQHWDLNRLGGVYALDLKRRRVPDERVCQPAPDEWRSRGRQKLPPGKWLGITWHY